MPSDYQKWIARSEKPEVPRELTPKERCANWWHYHWWQVALCLLAVVIVVTSAVQIIRSKHNQPDCQIAYLGTTLLPDDTIQALETQLAPLIGDVDQNGKIIIKIQQYSVTAKDGTYSAPDPNQQMAMFAQLSANENFLFLMDDPAAFQEYFGLLTLPDGSYPEDDRDNAAPLWYPWSECPALAELPLGSYALSLDGEAPLTGENQALMSTLYIGRSTVKGWTQAQADAYSEIWARISKD